MCAKEIKYGKYVADNLFFSRVLENCGVEKKYIGFYYIVDIMNCLINEHMTVKSFSKQMYPIIAEKYNKDVSTVERNIRNVIDKCWGETMIVNLKMLWPSNEKPTCCKFLDIVRTYIIMKLI